MAVKPVVKKGVPLVAAPENEFDELSLDINPNRLDEEWRAQAPRMYRAGVRLADLAKAVSDARANVKITKADIEANVRAQPAEYGIEKLTEAQVPMAIERDPNYQIAEKAVREAEYAHNVQEAYIKALRDRRYAIGDLVSLYLSQYGAAPDARTGEAHAAVAEGAKRTARRRAHGDSTEEVDG